MDSGRRQSPRIKARLKVRFKNASAFITEYTHNISKGGLFVRTGKSCELDSLVQVVLVIPETGQEVVATGKVVRVVTIEQADNKQPAGMGLQLYEIDPNDQKSIETYITDKFRSETPADGLGRRQHLRFETRIRVRFGSREALFEEYSHNISHGGIFIRTNTPKAMGEPLKIILTHPVTGHELQLEGEVVRVVTEAQAEEGHPPGMGVRFLNLDRSSIEQIKAFMKDNSNP
jgi:type IV pilus assembly protein PilZ